MNTYKIVQLNKQYIPIIKIYPDFLYYTSLEAVNQYQKERLNQYFIPIKAEEIVSLFRNEHCIRHKDVLVIFNSFNHHFIKIEFNKYYLYIYENTDSYQFYHILKKYFPSFYMIK